MNQLLFLHLIIGPLLLVLAILYRKFPPRKINSFYGYRTPRSMKSQEAWDRANDFSSKAMIIVSVLTIVMQLTLYFIMKNGTSALIACGVLVLGLIVSIPLTERHLKQNGF